MELGKYSIGIGDRFGHQAKAQLNALITAKNLGVNVTPVWNKSFREHEIIHSHPGDTRKKADEAIKELGWEADYFVDADHVNLNSIDLFIDSCDFFTIDVADFIGVKSDDSDLDKFVNNNSQYVGDITLNGISRVFNVSETDVRNIAAKYLHAVREAGRIYRHLLDAKNDNKIIVEISMDETEEPQTPFELLFILSAIADEKIPVNTIAPKFSGRFNKGVDYVGNVDNFRKEFEEDVAVIEFAKTEFNLPKDLKLSVHSGSDKFAIYKPINDTLKKFDAGLHLKTAGTTWLEELIGLSSAGEEGLEIAKEIYSEAYNRYDELCGPYATVIDIDKNKLPQPAEVNQWDSEKYASTLRHDQNNPNYNLHFRQLLHVGYKVAAEMKERYTDSLIKYESTIFENVIENIYERHIRKIFL